MCPYSWEVLVLCYFFHSWHNFAWHERNYVREIKKMFYQEMVHMNCNGCKQTLADFVYSQLIQRFLYLFYSYLQSAVMSKDGDLKIISAPEDSEPEAR